MFADIEFRHHHRGCAGHFRIFLRGWCSEKILEKGSNAIYTLFGQWETSVVSNYVVTVCNVNTGSSESWSRGSIGWCAPVEFACTRDRCGTPITKCGELHSSLHCGFHNLECKTVDAERALGFL